MKDSIGLASHPQTKVHTLEGSLPLIRRPGGAQLPYEMDPFGPKNRFYVWFQGRAYYSGI